MIFCLVFSFTILGGIFVPVECWAHFKSFLSSIFYENSIITILITKNILVFTISIIVTMILVVMFVIVMMLMIRS